MCSGDMLNQSQIYELYDHTTYILILGPSIFSLKGLSDLGILNEFSSMIINHSSGVTKKYKLSG